MNFKIDESGNAVIPVAEFYDGLASDYDLMTGFEKRFVKDRPFFRVLVEKYKIRSALDVGCGTGFHSLLLAQFGIEVTAVDISEAMIQRVEEHAKQLQVKVKVLKESFQNLSSVLKDRYDMVLSLGNSLAHILNEKEMEGILGGFRRLLNSKGLLFLQILNYERVLLERERIQSTRETPDKTFVRFYDYGENELSFNVLTRTKSDGVSREFTKTVRLHPWVWAELSGLLKKAGFENIHVYGGIAFQEFDAKTSQDLVVLAMSPE
ncbi:MAG TPA: methyltransferase domain-containing protein [Bacteroidota bacterium]|nr:methyltransferase domain-containing protein [Bacteroidota bacterium]